MGGLARDLESVTTYRSLLRQRPIRRILLGQAASLFGSSLIPIALTFAILAASAPLTLLGLAIALTRVPALIFFLLGGVVGDRTLSIRLISRSQVGAGLLNAGSAVSLLCFDPQTAVYFVILFGLLAGLLLAYATPSSTKLLRVLLPATEDLKAVASWNATVQNALHLLAQAAAGVLVFVASPALCFLINALSFLIYAASLRGINVQAEDSPAKRATQPIFAALAEGFSTIRGDRRFFPAFLMSSLGVFVIVQPFLTLTPALLESLHGDRGAAEYGLIGVVFGLGGILGGLILTKWRPRDPLRMSIALSIADVPLFLILGLHPSLSLILPAVLVVGVQGLLSRVWVGQAVLIRFPVDQMARIQAIMQAGFLLPALLGAAAAPAITEVIGYESFYVGAALLYAPVVIALTRSAATSNRGATASGSEVTG